MPPNDNNFSGGSFPAACDLVLRYLRQPAKAGDILEEMPSGAWGEASRRWLFLGVLRHLRFLREGLGAFLRHPPRVALESILLVAALEIWQTRQEQGRAARVVDAAVSLVRKRCSQGEAGMANAVLRRWAGRVSAGGIAMEFEMRERLLPEWLRQRWQLQRGPEWLQRQIDFLLQSPAVYVHWTGVQQPVIPELQETEWPGFYRLGKHFEPVLMAQQAGQATICDPATRLAVELLLTNQKNPSRILDLCAAPGGKTRALLAATPSTTRVLAVDLPARLQRLQDNVRPWGERVSVQGCDLLESSGDWQEKSFEAVLLDAPCSNTGVLGRKPDVKWRLCVEDLERLPDLQNKLLRRAAAAVKPGGLLVYSTCSLEPEENEALVREFLAHPDGSHFRWVAGGVADPPATGHDGAGFFALRSL